MMIPRFLAKSVEQALKRQAAVAIIGPRQVGKTTLAREIADSHPGALVPLGPAEGQIHCRFM